MEQKRTEADAILEAGARRGFGNPIQNPHQDGPAAIIIPADAKLEFFDRPAVPFRKKGIIELDDIDSFIAYYTGNNETHKAIYASLEPLSFVGLLNDHLPESGGGKQGWRDYGCRYTPRHSKEWAAWTGRNKNPFEGNDAFAEWLEDNLVDVIEPDNGKLLEIAINFKVNSTASFSNVKRLADGNTQMHYTNTVEGKSSTSAGEVKIPELFVIEIPVFQGRNATKYRVEARFRFRLHGGNLRIAYELVRPHKVIEQAFCDLVDKIANEATTAVLYGRHEAK